MGANVKWIESALIVALLVFLLAVVLSLNGCAAMLISSAMNKPNEALPPETIKAYNDIGSKVFACFNLGGPPPVGTALFIIVPRTAEVSPKFGDGCHLLN